MIWPATRTDDDRAVARRFLARRDESSFRALYRRHTPRLLRLASRLSVGGDPSVEDIVQDVWIRAVRALPKFEWKSSLSSWLSGIMINVVREERRNFARRRDVASQPTDLSSNADPTVSIALSDALTRLAEGYRSVLVLHDVGGFTHEEIAAMLGIEPGTSKSQLARARRRLREVLGPDKNWENE